MTKAKLCIGCKDRRSGETGSFLAELESHDASDGKGLHVAVSPVFGGVHLVFDWARENGWTELPRTPEHPLGCYAKADAEN